MTQPMSSSHSHAHTQSSTDLIQRGDGLQVVVGLGKSGLSVVKHLHAQGYAVAVTDGGEPSLATALPAGIITRFGQLDSELIDRASRIIMSPGIDPFLPIFANARAKQTPIVSDIQLFKDICHQKNIPIVAITGSNAKSTVTTLVGEMANNAGRAVGVGGNLGTPALDLLEQPLDLAVLELSSFQLQTVTDLSAQVATVLNMSPDHLDRHGDMLGYHQAKHRIFQGVKSIVVNRDDPLSRPLVADTMPTISFGSQAPDMHQYGLITDGNGDIWLAKGRERLLHEADLPIKGQHNLMNALSALALGESVGLPLDSMLHTLKNFHGLPHRCQFVAQVHGLDCYDDSKGTNIGSTIAAILGLGKVYAPKGKKLAVILGGQGKGQDFAELAKPLRDYASQVYLIGQDAQIIADDLAKQGLDDQQTAVNISFCQTLANAVEQAWQDSQASAELGVLLLSPACASFDQFKGYTDRGEQFQRLVN
ncbi:MULTISPECIES: UDP-N-acetylmuramoyl-L-alanine--D-glutamate ligase [unclassified Moraxella]|uniref:UDP-N-acetylmuramoyl-L-alanine--D-glutamate ligase n=1 Tax=unclassified Moraxella TaxID=2685852 RepID=UPI003AF468CB